MNALHNSSHLPLYSNGSKKGLQILPGNEMLVHNSGNTPNIGSFKVPVTQLQGMAKTFLLSWGKGKAGSEYALPKMLTPTPSVIFLYWPGLVANLILTWCLSVLSAEGYGSDLQHLESGGKLSSSGPQLWDEVPILRLRGKIPLPCIGLLSVKLNSFLS